MELKGVAPWLAILITILLVLPVLTPFYRYGMMGHWMMGFGWWWTPLFGLLFLALIVIGAYYLISGLQEGSRRRSVDRALEIARERYAKGEITKEVFEEIKRSLQEG